MSWSKGLYLLPHKNQKNSEAVKAYQCGRDGCLDVCVGARVRTDNNCAVCDVEISK